MVAAITPIAPFSCSTNLSNDVLRAMRVAKLGRAASEFCLYMHQRTFQSAGWHRQRGEHESECDFDLAVWSKATGINKANLRRVRADLERANIIRFEDAGDGTGHIAWNLDTNGWKRYDHRGLNRQQTPVVISQQTPVVISQQTPVVISHKTAKNNYGDLLNITTGDSFQPSAGEAPRAPKKGTEERDTEGSLRSPSGPSEEIFASAHISSSGRAREAEQGSLFADEAEAPTPRKATVKPKAAKEPKALDPKVAAQRYVTALITALREAMGVAELPREKWARTDARWFLTAGEDGQPATVDDVVACYKSLMCDPFWQAQEVSLGKLQGQYVIWKRDRDAFRRSHSQKGTPNHDHTRRATNGYGVSQRSAAAVSPEAGRKKGGLWIPSEHPQPGDAERATRKGGRWLPWEHLND